MDNSYKKLFENNRIWVDEQLSIDPDFFNKLSEGQKPEYLWIGCSDSRVHASEITGTKPGEMFVHRNIANIVVHSDMNILSVLSYAVEVLHVKHIIVCGHYGCGGIKAAMENTQHGLIDNWLRDIKDVYRKYNDELESIVNVKDRANRLTELNVMEQVQDLGHTTIVQNAWRKNRYLQIHGWVYDVKNGLIKDLDVTFSSEEDLHKVYKM
jgi:carbonic anhydrase